MKIVIIAPEHPNSSLHGGIARYLKDYVSTLANKVEVVMISIEDGEKIENVEQIIIPPVNLPSPIRPPVLSRKISKLLDNIKPDCVEYTNWLGLGCFDKTKYPKVVRISTPVMHGTLRKGILPYLARPMHHYWELLTVKNSDLVISNTLSNLKTCQDVYCCHKKKSKIVNHGLNLPLSIPSANARDILYVGRLEGRKGVDVMLKAWEEVIKLPEYDGQILHLVGRDMPGKSNSFFYDSLCETDIPKETYKVEGELDSIKLNELRKSCLISLVPSRYESFGMVVLEAYACGHAVISSNAGGLVEVVDDNKTGLLFENENSEDLANCIVRVLSNKEFLDRLASSGQQKLVNDFSIEQMVEKSLDIYTEVIKEK